MKLSPGLDTDFQSQEFGGCCSSVKLLHQKTPWKKWPRSLGTSQNSKFSLFFDHCAGHLLMKNRASFFQNRASQTFENKILFFSHPKLLASPLILKIHPKKQINITSEQLGFMTSNLHRILRIWIDTTWRAYFKVGRGVY